MQKAAEKRRVHKEIAILCAKRDELEQESVVECHKIDGEIAELEKQHTNK